MCIANFANVLSFNHRILSSNRDNVIKYIYHKLTDPLIMHLWDKAFVCFSDCNISTRQQWKIMEFDSYYI